MFLVPGPGGDTSSSAVFVNELPKNFQGGRRLCEGRLVEWEAVWLLHLRSVSTGDEALHFALGQLFGQNGPERRIRGIKSVLLVARCRQVWKDQEDRVIHGRGIPF